MSCSTCSSCSFNCCIDMCNAENPHGCCNHNSCLFHCWSFPLGVITAPLWMPPVCIGIYGYMIYNYISDTCTNASSWSTTHRAEYETVSNETH